MYTTENVLWKEKIKFPSSVEIATVSVLGVVAARIRIRRNHRVNVKTVSNEKNEKLNFSNETWKNFEILGKFREAKLAEWSRQLEPKRASNSRDANSTVGS